MSQIHSKDKPVVSLTSQSIELRPSMIREAFWGVARLSDLQLQPVKLILERYFDVVEAAETSFEEVNKTLKPFLDLEQKDARQIFTGNSILAVQSIDLGKCILNVELYAFGDFRIDILDLVRADSADRAVLKQALLGAMKRYQRCSKLGQVLEAHPEVLDQILEINISKAKEIEKLNEELKLFTNQYFWANPRLRADLQSMPFDYSEALEAINDNLFIAAPDPSSRFAKLHKAYLEAINFDNSDDVTIAKAPSPRSSSAGTKGVIYDLLEICDLPLCPLVKYGTGRLIDLEKVDLINSSEPLLANLSGLPKQISHAIRENFVSYVFNGVDDSGIRKSYMEFSDREFHILLSNQAFSPRRKQVLLAEGDDISLANAAFAKLMGSRD